MNRSKPDRNLANLERSGSTARVLNLLSVHRRQPGHPALAARPMFLNSTLNHAIILKHRLRPHERELFAETRTTATKVILPLDKTDLRAGGQSFFIGEERAAHILETYFSDTSGLTRKDQVLLEILDSIPSMDPFLLREMLARNGYLPALEYFSISEADLARMSTFVASEMASLTNLVTSGDSRGANEFTQKLLAETPDAAFAPLRDALRMDAEQYRDGIFAWRGLLYYKWIAASTLRESSKTCADITQFMPAPPRNFQTTEYIKTARRAINQSIRGAVQFVLRSLDTYNRSYNLFLAEERPSEFRDFLLNAPATFIRLGEVIGSLQHINSFWAFRMGALGRGRTTEADFADMLADFLSSLAFEQDEATTPPGFL